MTNKDYQLQQTKPALDTDPEQSKVATIKSSLLRNDLKKEKRRLVKNLIILSAGVMFVFSAYNCLANLQSSLNSEAGLGLASLSTTYVGLVLSCLFVPTYIIKKLGCKWTIVCSMIIMTPFVASTMYPTFYTMIPTAALVGLGSAPLWSAVFIYLTDFANRYAEIKGERSEDVVLRFFGVFFLIYQMNQIWGNLASSLILTPKSHEGGVTINADFCGAQYCNQPLVGFANRTEFLVDVFSPSPNFDYNSTSAMGSHLHDVDYPEAKNVNQLYLLCGVFLALAFLGIFIVQAFVDKLERKPTGSASESISVQILATFNLLKDVRLILLLPLSTFIGIELAFFLGDFTKSYLTCTSGIHNIGYVMMTSGMSDAIGSVVFGAASKYLGRFVLITFGTMLHGSYLVALLFWSPSSDQMVVFHLFAVVWGLTDSIWQTQVNALYGLLFVEDQEAGFSHLRLWQSVGFIIAFTWANLLCVYLKIYLMLGFLAISFIGFCIVENMTRKATPAPKPVP